MSLFILTSCLLQSRQELYYARYVPGHLAPLQVNTGLWLAETDHVTSILASDWPIQISWWPSFIAATTPWPRRPPPRRRCRRPTGSRRLIPLPCPITGKKDRERERDWRGIKWKNRLKKKLFENSFMTRVRGALFSKQTLSFSGPTMLQI